MNIKEGYREVIDIIVTKYIDCEVVVTISKTFTYKNPKRPSGDWIIEKSFKKIEYENK